MALPRPAKTRWHGEGRLGSSWPAPARPVLPAGDRYEMRTDIDVDVVHLGVGHGAALMVVGDQPFNNLGLACASLEVHGVATRVPRGPVRTGNQSTRSAGRYQSHGSELGLDALQQRARRRREAGPRCIGRDRKSTRLNSSHLGISYA